MSEKDKNALGAAAAFHDSRRQDDWLDVGHGQRAADAYADYCKNHGLEYDKRTYAVITLIGAGYKGYSIYAQNFGGLFISVAATTL